MKLPHFLLCLAALQQQASTHELEDGEIFEGDILWDENLKQFWDRTLKRSASPPPGNVSQKPGNISQKPGNNAQSDQSNGTLPNYVWNLKTSDNDGSLTYTIPYVTNEMTDPQSIVFIRVAMKEWNKGTCVQFVPRTTESNYVSFRPGSECSSYVGMVGGKQYVTISPGCQYDQGALMHELGHVLGLFHEHTRPDRDKYVEILEENLVPGKFETNFKKMSQSPSYVTDRNYDYISVMHYGRSHFSKAPYNLTTIRTLLSRYQNLIGQRTVLSAPDVEKVNFIYNCDCKIVNTTHTYTRRYWGECSYFFGMITWRCIKEEDVTEVWSKKMCTNKLTNDTD